MMNTLTCAILKKIVTRHVQMSFFLVKRMEATFKNSRVRLPIDCKITCEISQPLKFSILRAYKLV